MLHRNAMARSFMSRRGLALRSRWGFSVFLICDRRCRLSDMEGAGGPSFCECGFGVVETSPPFRRLPNGFRAGRLARQYGSKFYSKDREDSFNQYRRGYADTSKQRIGLVSNSPCITEPRP